MAAKQELLALLEVMKDLEKKVTPIVSPPYFIAREVMHRIVMILSKAHDKVRTKTKTPAL